jgi:NADPH:quinone reductase-like Zn-dependent oxidoreductase
VLSEQGLVHTPDHLTDIEAATLPCAAVTAWNALIEQGAISAADTVLVQGTGGVAIFGLLFARLHGARVIVTSSSDEKLERARALGAFHTINYRTTPDWDKQARAVTDNAGVDHIIEVGGADTIGRSLRAVRPGGTVSIIGVLGGKATELLLTPILMQNVRLQGVLFGSRDTFEAMNRAIAFHQLRPVVDTVFPFERAPEAFVHLAAGKHFGKVVISG